MARQVVEESTGMTEEGDRLRMRRNRLGLTKVDLEKLSGVSRGTIADIEKGKGFRVGTLRKLNRALDELENEDGIDAPPLPGDEPLISFEVRYADGRATVVVQGPVADSEAVADSVRRLLGEPDGHDQD